MMNFHIRIPTITQITIVRLAKMLDPELSFFAVVGFGAFAIVLIV